MRSISLIFFGCSIFTIISCGKAESKKEKEGTPIVPASATSLEGVKSIVASKRERINSMFAVVRPLEVPTFDTSTLPKLTEKDCLALKEQIKSAYKNVNPFEQKHETGTSTFDLCNGTDFKIVNGNYKTVIGSQANTLFQKVMFDHSSKTIQSILLSSGMIMLQISQQDFDRIGARGLVGNTLQFRDENGAYFEKNVITRLSSESGFTGPQTRLAVSSAEGDIVQAIEIRHQDETDSAKTIVRTQERIAIAQDWNCRVRAPLSQSGLEFKSMSAA